MRYRFVVFLVVALSSSPGRAQDFVPPLFLCGGDTVVARGFVPVGSSGENDEAAVAVPRWAFLASGHGELPSTRRRAFATTDECKPIDDGRSLLVTASSGGVALLDIATGMVVFSAQVPNAHSAEALPGGFLAVAASTHEEGNRVVLFDRRHSGTELHSIPLRGAHGVVYDAERELLYALGEGELVASALLRLPAEAPRLASRASWALPEGSRAGGHDLVPVPFSDDLLLTTEAEIFLFDRRLGTFRPHPTLGHLAAMKSVSFHPESGRIALVQADAVDWWSPRVTLANPPGRLSPGIPRVYKARFAPTPLPFPLEPIPDPERRPAPSRSPDSLPAAPEGGVSPRGTLESGPVLGAVTAHSAAICCLPNVSGRITAVAVEMGSPAPHAVTATAEAGVPTHRAVTFRFGGLLPNRSYRYFVTDDAGAAAALPDQVFRTLPEDFGTEARLAFGSCADESPGTTSAWRRIAMLAPDAVVLLGDTPYIDTTELATQRRRYREFAVAPGFRDLARSTPIYGTWDDHDFATNDGFGDLEGRVDARRAFMEYRPNPGYGEAGAGVYTSFRRGPVEVFLLDTRWFAGTEPSPVDPDEPTLFGRAQWEWLRRGLRASTAPFKILAAGMIWNDAVRPLKRDYIGAWPHEREALFRFLGEERIGGVVLVGGDIHRSRVVHHDSARTAGYPLTEVISSPLHDHIIASADAPHPGLVFDMGEAHAFLLVTATADEIALDLHTAAKGRRHREILRRKDLEAR